MQKKIEDFLGTHYEFYYNIWRTSLIFLKSAILTGIIVEFWYHFRSQLYIMCGLPATGSTAVEISSDLVVLMPALTYATLQGFIFNRILGQNNRIRSAIRTKNAVTFLEDRDQRTPYLVHVMMFVVSLITVVLATLCPYSSIEIAIFIIGICVFLNSFVFFISIELNNPFDGAYRIPPSCIPPGWMTMSIDDIEKNTVPHFQNPEPGYVGKSQIN